MCDEDEKLAYILDSLVEVNGLESRDYETDTGGRVTLGKRDDFVSSAGKLRHRDLACRVRF